MTTLFNRRTAPFVLLILAALIGAGLWQMQTVPATPRIIEETIQDTNIFIELDSTRQFRIGDCSTLRWQFDNIRAVLFNGQHSVGELEVPICNDTINRLQVYLPDDTFRQYVFQVEYTSTSFLNLAGGLVVFGLTIFGAYLLLEMGFMALLAAPLRRIPSIGWFIIGLVLAIGLGIWAQIPQSATIRDGDDTRGAVFSVDDTRRWWVQACYNVTWQVEDVSAVYLNDVGQIGQGETQLCPNNTAPLTLSVTYSDGESMDYQIAPQYLLFDWRFGLGATLAIAALWIGLFGMFGHVLSRWATVGVWLVESIGIVFPLVFVAIVSSAQAIQGRVLMPQILTLLAVSLGVALIAWGIMRWRWRVSVTLPTADERVRVALFLLPLMMYVIAGATLMLMPEKFHGGDGIVHSSVAYTVQNMGIPPENPYLAGRTLNYYWMYNTLVGSLGAIVNAPPPVGAVILHLTTLVTIIYVGAVIIRKTYGNVSGLTLGTLTLFVLFGYHLLVSFFYVVNANLYNLRPLMFYQALAGPSIFSTFGWSILTYQGYPFGLMMVLVSLMGLAYLMRDGVRFHALFFAGAGVIGAVAYHPQSALIYLSAVIIAYLITINTPRWTLIPTGRSRWNGFWHYIGDLLRERLALLIGAVVTLLAFSLPVIFHLLSATADSGGGLIGIQGQSQQILIVTLPLLPLFVLSMRRAIREQDDWVLFLGWLSLTIYALGFVLYLGGLQFEKFHAQGSIIFHLVVAGTLLRWLTASDSNHWQQATAKMVLLLAIVNVTWILYLGHLQPIAFNQNTNGTVQFEGTTLRIGNDPLQPTCDWVRENTPTDAVIVNGLSSIYQPTIMLCQRSVFLGDTNHMTELDSQFMPRVEMARSIFGTFDDLDTRIRNIRALQNYEGLEGRMILLLLTDESRTTLSENLPSDRLLYEDTVYSLYRIDGAWD